MSVHDHRCGDCQTCPNCGNSAWCEGDRILVIPCDHHGYCGDCNVENCADCRRDAERDMYETGAYDPRADPFYLPEKRAEADHYWDRAGSHFDPVTNSYRYPKGKP